MPVTQKNGSEIQGCDRVRFSVSEDQLVALCDTSMTRMKVHANRIIENHKHPPVPMYLADKFDQMVKEQKPDVVITTTVDCFHDVYITRAMELGCDAITEKPMTTDAERCRRQKRRQATRRGATSPENGKPHVSPCRHQNTLSAACY